MPPQPICDLRQMRIFTADLSKCRVESQDVLDVRTARPDGTPHLVDHVLEGRGSQIVRVATRGDVHKGALTRPRWTGEMHLDLVALETAALAVIEVGQHGVPVCV